MIRFISNKLDKMHSIIEMSQITRPNTNDIKGYEYLQIFVYGSGNKKFNGGSQEHDPPHFHLIHKDGYHILNVTINIETLEIESIIANNCRELKFNYKNNSFNWEMSGQLNLKKQLEAWLKKKNKFGITNIDSIKLQWNDNNPSLTQCF